MRQIQDSAKDNGIAVALGFSERDGESIYIAQALIAADGKLAMKRRKLKPTSIEQSVFGSAGADCLSKLVTVSDGDVQAKVGQLNCWEHVQPLLKFYTFSQGEQIHVAAWPPLTDFSPNVPALWSMRASGKLFTP
jgi:predicted amidohydrolase